MRYIQPRHRAYPYGEAHKEKIGALIKEFITDEDDKFAVYNYLVCRQYLAPNTYEGKYVVQDDQFKEMLKKYKKDVISKGKKEMHKYMALVEADLIIDEEFNYPSMKN